MRDFVMLMRPALALPVAAAAFLAVACQPSEPRTDAERLARGREIIDRMSAKLGSTPAFTVATTELREENKSSGRTSQLRLVRETTVRRPDRLYSKVTGDHENEVWYDGVGVTLVLHKHKVFGQSRAPETLDKTLDAIYERYGVATPVSDFVYSSPSSALLTTTTTGGWVGREIVQGRQVDHLSFKDKGVSWEIWIAAEGDPLPVRGVAEFSEDKRIRRSDLTFTAWDLSPQIPGNRFTPTVPADYEGVAMVQRARVLRNLAHDEPPAPAATPDKK